MRVGELAEHGRWFDKFMPRSNVPFGEELQWTRFLDLRLLAGAAPLIPFLGVRAAIHWWGVAMVLLGPVCNEASLYRQAEGAPTLYRRLEAGEPPGLLGLVPLPEDRAAGFRLYEVTA